MHDENWQLAVFLATKDPKSAIWRLHSSLAGFGTPWQISQEHVGLDRRTFFVAFDHNDAPLAALHQLHLQAIRTVAQLEGIELGFELRNRVGCLHQLTKRRDPRVKKLQTVISGWVAGPDDRDLTICFGDSGEWAQHDGVATRNTNSLSVRLLLTLEIEAHTTR